MWYNSKDSDQLSVTDIITEFLRSLSAKAAESPTIFVQRQRLIKSPAEIQLLRKTCEIASISINETMRDTKPGIYISLHS